MCLLDAVLRPCPAHATSRGRDNGITTTDECHYNSWGGGRGGGGVKRLSGGAGEGERRELDIMTSNALDCEGCVMPTPLREARIRAGMFSQVH